MLKEVIKHYLITMVITLVICILVVGIIGLSHLLHPDHVYNEENTVTIDMKITNLRIERSRRTNWIYWGEDEQYAFSYIRSLKPDYEEVFTQLQDEGTTVSFIFENQAYYGDRQLYYMMDMRVGDTVYRYIQDSVSNSGRIFYYFLAGIIAFVGAIWVILIRLILQTGGFVDQYIKSKKNSNVEKSQVPKRLEDRK